MAKREGSNINLELDMSPLLKGTLTLDKRLDNGVAGVMEYWDGRIEAGMKTGATWTDRTGNARAGLRAVAGHRPFVAHWIDMFHSVAYGIWLEVRFAGRYAIIIPSLITYGPRVMATMNKLFARLGGGSTS